MKPRNIRFRRKKITWKHNSETKNLGNTIIRLETQTRKHQYEFDFIIDYETSVRKLETLLLAWKLGFQFGDQQLMLETKCDFQIKHWFFSTKICYQIKSPFLANSDVSKFKMDFIR